MLSFSTFLSESATDFVDLQTAIKQARQAGFDVSNDVGFLYNIPINKVPTNLQTAPEGIYRFYQDDENGVIALYEPTNKRNMTAYTDKSGQAYAEVELWHLRTSVQEKADAEHAQKRKDDEDHYKTVVKPKVIQWMKTVFDSATKHLKTGHQLYITTHMTQTKLRSPNDITFDPKGGISVLRGYRKGKPYSEWLTIEHVGQIARQLNLPDSP